MPPAHRASALVRHVVSAEFAADFAAQFMILQPGALPEIYAFGENKTPPGGR
jgi:hypothetical protein